MLGVVEIQSKFGPVRKNISMKKDYCRLRLLIFRDNCARDFRGALADQIART